MDPAVIGVFIPIIAITMGMGLGGIGMWTQHKQKMIKLEVQRAEALAAAAQGRAGEQAAQVAEFEDRLRVLERIVTDRGYDVATQIEALRDQRRTEDQLERLEDRSVA